MPDKNIHKYPQTKSSTMKAIDKTVLGTSKKEATEKGPHLLTGKSTSYNLAKITSTFMTQDTRPGHTQKQNIDK